VAAEANTAIKKRLEKCILVCDADLVNGLFDDIATNPESLLNSHRKQLYGRSQPKVYVTKAVNVARIVAKT
jgi:hypothetical protein